jgi:hypothetical protein
VNVGEISVGDEVEYVVVQNRTTGRFTVHNVHKTRSVCGCKRAEERILLNTYTFIKSCSQKAGFEKNIKKIDS